jgi:hypothetical protein
MLFISTLVGDERSVPLLGLVSPREMVHITRGMGDWVGPANGLVDESNKILTLSGLKLRPLDCSDCSQSLYRLH